MSTTTGVEVNESCPAATGTDASHHLVFGECIRCGKGASMTTETRTANERLARLLGWELHKDGHWNLLQQNPTRLSQSADCPDYTTWERFPELQAYVRGLGLDKMNAIEARLIVALKMDGLGSYFDDFGMWTITPEILGNAILEVCDE